MKRINYFRSVFQRFGMRAVIFLITSKFRKQPTKNIRIRNIKYPVTLSNFKEDVTTLFQVFFAKEYEIVSERKISNVIDCGANVGLSAIYFANRYPQAKVIAIEPDDINFSFLKLNTKNYSNVVCLQRAIWPVSTMLEVIDPGNGGWSLQTKMNTDGKVKSITIGDILEEFQFPEIDLLKIDIEGAERELFENNYESWLSKTNIITIELHDFLQPGTSDHFFDAIKPYDFKMRSQGENLVCER